MMLSVPKSIWRCPLIVVGGPTGRLAGCMLCGIGLCTRKIALSSVTSSALCASRTILCGKISVHVLARRSIKVALLPRVGSPQSCKRAFRALTAREDRSLASGVVWSAGVTRWPTQVHLVRGIKAMNNWRSLLRGVLFLTKLRFT